MALAGLPLGPLPDFERASRATLAYLHETLGMGLWMVTRVNGDDWVVLTSVDDGYGVDAGRVFRWHDSICSRLVAGSGPSIAPSVEAVDAYRDAPIREYTEIGAYIGVPILAGDGELFGTLCAIDPSPQPEALTEALPLVELLAGQLSGILSLEVRLADAERAADRARFDAALDPLTGLCNRRGWDALVEAEESRARRHGNPISVIWIDVDGLKQANDTLGHEAGDDLLRRCGIALSAAVRRHDVAARVGGDEFAVLAVHADAAGVAVLVERIERALAATGVRASLGAATRDPARGLVEAVLAADAAMYEMKRQHRESAA